MARSPAVRLPIISSHSASLPCSWLRPSAVNSASDSTIGSVKPLRPSMSNTTIFCKVGHRERHDRILSSCSSSSAKITLVEESLIRYSTCDDEVGRIDAGRNAAGAQDAHVGIDPFRHRVGDDRGDVAGPEAARHAGRRRCPWRSAATRANWSAARCRISFRGSPAGRRGFPRTSESSSRSCRRPSALPVWPCALPPSVACFGHRSCRAGSGFEAGPEFSSNSFLTPCF